MTTIKEVPFDEMVELMWEVDSFLSSYGETFGSLRVSRYVTATKADSEGRQFGETGLVEGELMVPVGIVVHHHPHVRLRHEEPGAYGYQFADVTAFQLDDKFPQEHYQRVSELVHASGLAVGLGDLFTAVAQRINRKPALREALLKKLARAKAIRAGAKSEAEELAVRDFYKDRNYGEF